MAHFFGSIQGQRGEATRLGSKASALSVTAASWQGAVTVDLYYDKDTGTDHAVVALTPWHGKGESRELYRGPVGGAK